MMRCPKSHCFRALDQRRFVAGLTVYNFRSFGGIGSDDGCFTVGASSAPERAWVACSHAIAVTLVGRTSWRRDAHLAVKGELLRDNLIRLA